MSGQVLLTLIFEDGAAADGRPRLGTVGAELYDALHPFAWADREHGWALAHMCEAVGRMWQAVADLVHEDEQGRPGWSAVMDVDRAPGAGSEIDCLPFLAQFAGVRLQPGMTDSERRAAIRAREGYHRGRPGAIIDFALTFTDRLPGSVYLRERYDPDLGAGVDAPGHGRVVIRRSRLAAEWQGREAEIRALVLARIPAGLLYDVLITDEHDYDEVLDTYSDYDDVKASVRDYDELLGG